MHCLPMLLLTFWMLVLLATIGADLSQEDVQKWAKDLGTKLYSFANEATQADEILRRYESAAEVEHYSPDDELDLMVGRVEKYLKLRKKLAEEARFSLQNREIQTNVTELVNDPHAPEYFVRYINAETGNDAAWIQKYPDTDSKEVKPTSTLTFLPNPNFYNLSLNLTDSAVHVPVPVYNRARRWNEGGGVDLFDCRTTSWYISAATGPKNILILLDMSGSMLGQRFEIAKQTIEVIMETLSENDFFNIIVFNQKPDYLSACYNRTLIQASLRNRKLLRAALDNATVKEMAMFEKALPEAFELLLNLNVTANWTTKKDLPEGATLDEYAKVFDSGHIMLLDEEYNSLVSSASNMVACNSAIMLITDGAPKTYEDIFNYYNAEKKIRVFSFLIGNEATDFMEKYVSVMSRSVALRPKVEPKRDNSIWTGVYFEKLFFDYGQRRQQGRRRPKEVLRFRPPNHPRRPRPESMLLTTTVAYPVIKELDGVPQLLGVAGVAVPMIELQQMAPSHRLGLNAYSFMVDNNGYVMFHPQLRPLAGSVAKPNYNSMDIMEMEPLQDQELRDVFLQFESFTQRRLDCKLPGASEVGTESGGSLFERTDVTYKIKMRHFWEASECFMRSNESDVIKEFAKTIPFENWTATVSYALEYDSERRVYKQRNMYYTRGIQGTLFSLGLAVPSEGQYRVKSKEAMDYGSVKSDEDNGWFSGTNWRLHPTWRYCFLNDSDGNKSPEEGFLVYVKQMAQMKSLPALCEDRKDLVDRLLFDAKTTAFISSKWIPKHVEDAKYGIHLVFFASESGLTRYANVNLDSVEFRYSPFDKEGVSGVEVSDANATNAAPKADQFFEPHYMHYIHNRLRGPEETFYKRAMQFIGNDIFVFDLNLDTQVYNKESRLGVYGENESISLLVTAVKSLSLKLDSNRAPLGVVGLEMLYDKFAGLVVDASDRRCSEENMRCFLLDEHGYVVYSSHETSSYTECMETGYRAGCKPPPKPSNVNKFNCKIGQFFGDLCAPEQHLMDGLIKREVYQKVTYVDYQALCRDRTLRTKGAGSRVLSPFYNFLRAMQWAWREILMLFAEYSVWSLLAGFLMPVKAYTESFGDPAEGLPCDKASFFYILNKEKLAELKDGTLYGSACSDGCKIRPQVSLVPNTNLLFAAFEMNSAEKCLSPQCNRDNWIQNKRLFRCAPKSPLFYRDAHL